MTDVQFLLFFSFRSLFILIFLVLSYFSPLSLCADFSDISPRNTVIAVAESRLIIFQRVMNSILTDLETLYIFHGTTAPSGTGSPHYQGFTITLRHATLYILLWTSDQPDTDTYLYLTTHNTHKRQAFITPGETRTHNPSKRMATDPCLRPRCHWDRLVFLCMPICGLLTFLEINYAF